MYVAPHLVTLTLALTYGGFMFAQEQELTSLQRSAVKRQEKNQADYEKKFQALRDKYTKEIAGYKDTKPSPSFVKGYLTQVADGEKKLAAMSADLEKYKCPSSHPEVKAVLSWVESTTKSFAEWKKELDQKLSESEQTADAKNYPDLPQDTRALRGLTDSYRRCDLEKEPEKACTLIATLPNVGKWYDERFTFYKPYIVANGGKSCQLFQDFDQAAKAMTEFELRKSTFIAQAEKKIPALLKEAEEAAARAVAGKNPALISGTCRPKLDMASRQLKVARAIAEKDPKVQSWQAQCEAALKKIAESEAALREGILSEARAPKEVYVAGDKEDLRSRLASEWKKAYPSDEVMAIRLDQKDWERITESRWGGSAWTYVDFSLLSAVVIVKSDAKVAVFYRATLSRDHQQGDALSAEVDDKPHRRMGEMLVENSGK